MRVLLYASLAGALLVPSTGCLTVRANVPDALNIPEPPARVVTPPSTPTEPPPTVVPPPPPPPPTQQQEKPPTNPAGGNPAARPPQNTTPATTATPPPENPAVLQTRQGKDLQFLESKVIQQLSDAKRDLARIDRRQLSREAQAQYQVAQQLYRVAEDALKGKNFDYADSQSQKAALMAAQLANAKGRPEPSPTSP